MATKTRDTVDIIKDLVALLTPTVVIENAFDNGNETYDITTLDTFWLQPGKKIIIGGKAYRIISFVINELLVIKDIDVGAGVPTAMSFSVPAPFFYHGVTQNASQEHNKEKLAEDRNPFVWLYEVLLETTITDIRVPWGRRSTPRLYFMNEARSKDWLPADHKINVIEPMRQMVELFISKIEDKSALYSELLEFDSTARANWGNFIVDKGNGKRWFKDDLSGHQVGFEFMMSKTLCDKRLSGFACSLSVTMDKTDPTTPGGSDGTATANESGAQGNVTYLWTTIDGSIPAGEEIKKTATGLIEGTYTVVVTDDVIANCTASDSITLEDTIASNLILRLDPSDASTINTPNPPLPNVSDPVSFYKDLSPSGNDLDNVVASFRPLWNTDSLLHTDSKYLESVSTDFNLSGGSFTISSWVNLTATGANDFLGKWRASDTQLSYKLRGTGGSELKFFIYTTTAVILSVGSGVTFALSNWYFVVGVWDASAQLIKVSATKEGDPSAQIYLTAANPNGVASSNAPLRLGFNGGAGITGESGKAYIYNEARSQAQTNTDFLIGH